MNNEHHGGGFLNGFFFGLMVGAGLVFLFGTNKGRKVLQMLLDQIEENTELSELLEMPDGEEEEEYVDALEEEPEQDEEVHEIKSKPKAETSKPARAVAKVKRFFKGAPKKMVS